MTDFALTPSERHAKDSEIKRLTDALEIATEEITYWKDLAELRGQQKVIDDISVRCKISVTLATLLAALIRRYPLGVPLTADDLDHLIPGNDYVNERCLNNILAVYLYQLRRKFGAHCFTHIRNVGVLLTEQGYKQLVM